MDKPKFAIGEAVRWVDGNDVERRGRVREAVQSGRMWVYNIDIPVSRAWYGVWEKDLMSDHSVPHAAPPIDPDNADTFWIVWCPTGPTNPARRFDGEEEAIRSAEAMAAKYPGEIFYALEAKHLRHVGGMKRLPLTNMPF